MPKKIFYQTFSIWSKLLFLVAILLILMKFIEKPRDYEGMTTIQGNVEKKGKDMYDDFYSEIYDYILYDEVKNDFIIGEIVNQTQPNSESIVLNIGTSTGHLVNLLKLRGIPAVGLDKSKSMAEMSIKNYPEITNKIMVGDPMDTKIFSPYTYTHVLCLGTTIYELKHKTRFIENIYDWLMPGGYFILQLVNRDNWKPFISLNVNKRPNQYKIPFVDFDYDSYFQSNGNDATYTEKFRKLDGSGTRKQTHHLYMDSQASILSIAQQVGFIIMGKIDLAQANYKNEFLYILTKPN